MNMIGLRQQTVHGARSIAEARARHRWNIPTNYNVTVDCLDRHDDLRDKPALYYEDDDGRVETYTFGKMGELSRRFANAIAGLGIKRGDVVAIHLPQRPETAIAHMGLYRIGAIALPNCAM
jgi:acetyl-CoA synthetase